MPSSSCLQYLFAACFRLHARAVPYISFALIFVPYLISTQLRFLPFIFGVGKKGALWWENYKAAKKSWLPFPVFYTFFKFRLWKRNNGFGMFFWHRGKGYFNSITVLTLKSFLQNFSGPWLTITDSEDHWKEIEQYSDFLFSPDDWTKRIPSASIYYRLINILIYFNVLLTLYGLHSSATKLWWLFNDNSVAITKTLPQFLWQPGWFSLLGNHLH